MKALATLVEHRRMLRAMVLQSTRSRIAGNVLGLAWVVFYPLAFLAMYALVFLYVLDVRPSGMAPATYVLTIFSGLVPFLAFSEAFSQGAVSITSSRGLIQNTLFPIELVVARDVIAAHVPMAFGSVAVFVAVGWWHGFHAEQALVPVIYLLQLLWTLGLAWIVATMAVFFRDIVQAIPLLVLFTMMVSPIAYTTAMVPEGLRPLLQLNPLAWWISAYRACLFEGRVPWQELGVLVLLTLGFLFVGHALVTRLKPLFADHV